MGMQGPLSVLMYHVLPSKSNLAHAGAGEGVSKTLLESGIMFAPSTGSHLGFDQYEGFLRQEGRWRGLRLPRLQLPAT